MSISTRLYSVNTAIKNRRSILYKLPGLVLLSAICLSVSAAQLYRYKNEQGVLVLTQTLPAEYASKGYEILNEKGRLIKVVPPALSPEQIAERDAALEKERLANIEKQKQDKIDEDLRLLYSHPNDAVRVLERRLLDFKGLIEVKHAKIKGLQTQITDEEAAAAARERRGLSVTEESLNKIANLQKEILRNKTDIDELNRDITRLLIEFDEKIKRLEVITEQVATDYPALLESLKTAPTPAQENSPDAETKP